MKKKTIYKRKLSKDCWNLDDSFLKWLKERLPIYLKEAGRIVDLEYYKFEFKDKEWTQKALIKEMIRLLDEITNPNADQWCQEYLDNINDLLSIWKLVFNSMWW